MGRRTGVKMWDGCWLLKLPFKFKSGLVGWSDIEWKAINYSMKLFDYVWHPLPRHHIPPIYRLRSNHPEIPLNRRQNLECCSLWEHTNLFSQIIAASVEAVWTDVDIVAGGRIVVACFAVHLGRLDNILWHAGRRVAPGFDALLECC